MQGAGTSVEAVDLFEQGFQLAYFLVPDRSLAVRVLADAVNRLNVRCRQENKRAYWRDKYLKHRASKISRADEDTLQWLIYFASEKYERQIEERGEFSIEDLIVRYVKSLVQTTTGMSSFYVATGIHRLLHNYSTAEVQRMYELFTDRYLGTDEYRRAKRLVMRKIVDRFGSIVSTTTAAHGEMRFEACQDQSSWVDVVRECLRAFVPWSTRGRCLLQTNSDGGASMVPDLLSGRDKTVSPDVVETNRCHALIDPTCFGRLIEMLRLDSSESRLALPKFQLSVDHANKPRGPRQPTDLTPSERAAIQAQLATESARRRGAPARIVRVLLDGSEHAVFDPCQKGEVRIDLTVGAKIAELWTNDECGELLLGTHLLRYGNAERLLASTACMQIAGSEVEIIVSDDVSGDENADRAILGSLHVSCIPPVAHLWPEWSRSLQYAALALALIALGWVGGTESRNRALRTQRARMENVKQELPTAVSPPSPVSAVTTQRLIPYDETRGGESSAVTQVQLAPQTQLVELDLPIPASGSATFTAILKTFPQRTLLMSEQLTSDPSHAAGFLRLSVPSNLLASSKTYIIDLTARVGARNETVRTYIFQVGGDQR